MDDHENSVLSFIRHNEDGESVVVVCNLTPTVRYDYRVGVPTKGLWKEIFNSDGAQYGGSDISSGAPQDATDVPMHHQEQSISITLPPLSVVYLSKE